MKLHLFEDSAPKKAVAYYRRSTRDMQEYSIEIQQDQAKEFADKHNIEIIHELEDRHTGLLAERPGFQKLLHDWVTNPKAPKFDHVLVLDDSRWGRYQDNDEAAYYEFLCKKNGKKVLYTSEDFPAEEENATFTGVMRSLKRASAADYSRELSKKVFNGCVKISSKGYSVGGVACYGYSRLLLNEQKEPERILKKGQRKALANGRIIFIPSNDDTTRMVKEIFKRFSYEEELPRAIAISLNKREIPAPNGKSWNHFKIIRLLSNETYIGTLLYNKTSNKLKRGHKKNLRDEWVIVPQAFEPIVDEYTFHLAREKLYWLIPSRCNRGIYKIRKVERLLRQELEKYLLDKKIDSDSAIYILQHLPVFCSVAFFNSEFQDRKHWCFCITDSTRKYDYILGIGLDKESNNIVDHFFLIPTSRFSINGYYIFSEADNTYTAQRLQEDELTKQISELVNQVKKHNFHVDFSVGISGQAV